MGKVCPSFQLVICSYVLCHSRVLTVMPLCLCQSYCLSYSKWIFQHPGAIRQSDINVLNFLLSVVTVVIGGFPEAQLTETGSETRMK